MNYSLRFVATGLLVMAANSCTIIAAEERGQGSAVADAAVTVEPTPASDWERASTRCDRMVSTGPSRPNRPSAFAEAGAHRMS
jgi:hypothetical protein